MALLPSLSDQILSHMDVDSLTHQLKSLSVRNSPPSPSVASSIDLVPEHDIHSDAASSVVSAPDSIPASGTDLSSSGLQSWVDASSSSSALPQLSLPQPSSEYAPESIGSSIPDVQPSVLASPSGSKLVCDLHCPLLGPILTLEVVRNLDIIVRDRRKDQG